MSSDLKTSNMELYHHGILGMKWGVRRYQNSDGSLTEAGKQRYRGSSGQQKLVKDMFKDKDYRKARDDYEASKVGNRWLKTFEEAGHDPYKSYKDEYNKDYDKRKMFDLVFDADDMKRWRLEQDKQDANNLTKNAPTEAKKAITQLSKDMNDPTRSSDFDMVKNTMDEIGIPKNKQTRYLIDKMKDATAYNDIDYTLYQHLDEPLGYYSKGLINKETFDHVLDKYTAETISEYGPYLLNNATAYHNISMKEVFDNIDLSKRSNENAGNNRLTGWFGNNDSNPEYKVKHYIYDPYNTLEHVDFPKLPKIELPSAKQKSSKLGSNVGGKKDREWKEHKWTSRKRDPKTGKWIYDYGDGYSNENKENEPKKGEHMTFAFETPNGVHYTTSEKEKTPLDNIKSFVDEGAYWLERQADMLSQKFNSLFNKEQDDGPTYHPTVTDWSKKK